MAATGKKHNKEGMLSSLSKYLKKQNLSSSVARFESYHSDKLDLEATASTSIDTKSAYYDALDMEVGPIRADVNGFKIALTWCPTAGLKAAQAAQDKGIKFKDSLFEDRYGEHWAVHGVWQFKSCKKRHPNAMPGSMDDKYWEFLEPYRETLEPCLTGPSLGFHYNHEWTKHGQYLKVSNKDYFYMLVELGSKMIPLIESALTSGGYVPDTNNPYLASNLSKAIQEKLGAPVCIRAWNSYLEEVQVAFDTDFNIIPCERNILFESCFSTNELYFPKKSEIGSPIKSSDADDPSESREEQSDEEMPDANSPKTVTKAATLSQKNVRKTPATSQTTLQSSGSKTLVMARSRRDSSGGNSSSGGGRNSSGRGH